MQLRDQLKEKWKWGRPIPAELQLISKEIEQRKLVWIAKYG